MTLPNGVTIKPEGTIEFVTQRGYWTPPYKSCMFASLCMVLEFMGYDLPLERSQPAPGAPDNFVHLLHVNSGKFNHPTNTADTKVALQTTFGDENLPLVKYGLMPDDVLLEQLAGSWAVRITVSHMSRMPHYLRRWAGYTFDGGHAMALLDAKQENGVWLVFLADPMGKPSRYDGQWVPYDDIKDALDRTDGKVQVTVGELSTAFEFEPEPPVGEVTMPMIVKGRRDQFVPVKKGTPFLRPDTLAQVTKSAVDADFGVVGFSEDGKYTAVRVRTLKFPGGLVVLFAETALLGEPYIKEPTPA